jgi:molybdate transport system substrate-binding protein
MRRLAAAALVSAGIAAAGCGSSSSTTTSGGSSSGTPSGGTKPSLTVSAAASLRSSFTKFATEFPTATVHYSFAGSDQLAAQIEQGVKPDVFAAANLKLPKLLYAKGLVAKPVSFAANKLVLAVPAGSTKVKSLADVEKAGVTIAVGSGTVPIGSYTRTVLAKLGSSAATRIMHNVRSEEPDVSGIVGKLSQGAVDAGFTYVTDVQATKGKLKAIALPASLQPVVAYGVAVVKGSSHPTQAREFIAGLLRGAGRRDLLQAGFLAPPP